jgi:hypothetical protein
MIGFGLMRLYWDDGTGDGPVDDGSGSGLFILARRRRRL